MSIQYSKNELVNNLQHMLVASLSNIVDGKNLLLFGQTIALDTARHFLFEAGAATVHSINIPYLAIDKISSFYYYQNKQFQHPDENLKSILKQINPEGNALVYTGSITNVDNVDGRRIIGYRQPQWAESERKKIQTFITKDQKGYNPVYIEFSSIDSEDDFVNICAKQIPCVISGDTKEQIEMGADYVYIITHETDRFRWHIIFTSLVQYCTGFRIASLTTGIPITVYGYFDGVNNITIFPPVESIVGYRKIDKKIFAPGVLVPICEHVDVSCVENSVRSIIGKLSTYCGYRGAFGVDGVFSDNGFIIHEINPRICAGFLLISQLLKNELPLGLIDMLIRESADGFDKIFVGLCELISIINYPPELKLWDNPSLEQKLRKCIPEGDSETIEKWKIVARNKILMECVPLIDFDFRLRGEGNDNI